MPRIRRRLRHYCIIRPMKNQYLILRKLANAHVVIRTSGSVSLKETRFLLRHGSSDQQIGSVTLADLDCGRTENGFLGQTIQSVRCSPPADSGLCSARRAWRR